MRGLISSTARASTRTSGTQPRPAAARHAGVSGRRGGREGASLSLAFVDGFPHVYDYLNDIGRRWFCALKFAVHQNHVLD
jgi:hypothetical protein